MRENISLYSSIGTQVCNSHSQKVVVVSFFIVDRARNMQEGVPHIALGRLPLRER